MSKSISNIPLFKILADLRSLINSLLQVTKTFLGYEIDIIVEPEKVIEIEGLSATKSFQKTVDIHKPFSITSTLIVVLLTIKFDFFHYERLIVSLSTNLVNYYIFSMVDRYSVIPIIMKVWLSFRQVFYLGELRLLIQK